MRSLRCSSLLTAALTVAIHAFSAPKSTSFRIVGDFRTGTQYLPTSYALRFVRWELDRESHLIRTDDQPFTSQSSDGVYIRPTMDFVLKGGVPAYCMVGLQTISSRSNAGSLHSSTIAQQWLPFDMIVEPNMRLLVFRGEGDGTDERLALFGPDDVGMTLQRLGVALSMESEHSEQLNQGFHIVSIPINDEWISVTKDEGSFPTTTCMVTAEPEPRELLTLDDSLLELTATSLLQFNLENTIQERIM
ncbi:hypothetical protein FisN_11Hu052 [Fistulifera solaris]|jgi:hypothetical protein|uniref:Uncharacterized protein n=1 Tax=Fistulifera solaris TaxID=1519565 RepID=A0A1Z5JKF1_FISSO|nr:hypothetical protein FisN_11Hu052 [Fistulifera solaris]|eukprot:GAX14487.1 hypothetical protein FisN_11Hu052 [Fistulifera solaris]